MPHNYAQLHALMQQARADIEDFRRWGLLQTVHNEAPAVLENPAPQSTTEARNLL